MNTPATQPPADEKLMPPPFEVCSQCGGSKEKCQERRCWGWVNGQRMLYDGSTAALEAAMASKKATPPAAPAELDAIRVLNNELRAQVERLEGERGQLRLDLRDMMVRGDAYMEEVDRVRDERDAARAELAAVRAGAVTDEMAWSVLEKFITMYAGAQNVPMPKEKEKAKGVAAMRAALQAVVGSGWIKCSERMPEEGTAILVARPTPWGTKVEHAINQMGAFRGTSCWWHDGKYVTHWRPLPPPPGEGE
jgi:hypothetical protein